MFPNFNLEENSRQHHLGEENVSLLSNPGSKSLNRKSVKKLSCFPCCKRPRTDQPNEFVMTDGPNDHDAKRYDHVRCLSYERFHIVKQKHGQDSRRMDKRRIKASVKIKFDPCTSKASLSISDSASGGIDKIGIYGLKTDLHDVTKHVEALSLDELLDGSYKYPNLCAEKGKKASGGNENFHLSVRKACNILALHGNTDNDGNITSLPNTSSLDRDEKDKCCEESSNKDSSLAMLNTSTLYQPKDVLGRLALTTLDLEDFMLNSNPSQGATHRKTFYTTRLPAFSWSFSHGGPCKPGVDSCKISSPWSAFQSKWVRVGTMSTSSGDDNNCFSSLEVKRPDHIGDLANQQKIDVLLQDIELLTETIMPSFERPQHTSESYALDHNTLIQGSDASASLNSGRLGVLDGRMDAGDSSQLNAAAAILCEMASCSNAIRTQDGPSLRSKWPRPQKNIKDHKSTSSLEKAKRLLLSSGHQDTFKTKKTLSQRAHSMDRGPMEIKDTKVEKDRVRVNHSLRPPGLMQSPIRIGKAYGNQLKFGKETLKASSTAYGRNYINDWSRGKIKRG